MITSLSTIIGTQLINGIEIIEKDDLFHVKSIVIFLFVHIQFFFYILRKLKYIIMCNNEEKNNTCLIFL